MSGCTLQRIALLSTALPSIVFGVMLQPAHCGTTIDPLVGDGVNPVIFYYDYSDDGLTGPQRIYDRTGNTTDTMPPDPEVVSIPPPWDTIGFTSDDLATGLVTEGNGTTGDFVFTSADEDFLLPGARVFDVATTGHGGLTVTHRTLTHQAISDAGGFTFETYLKRTSVGAGGGDPAVTREVIFAPEGTFTIYIVPPNSGVENPNDFTALQVAFRATGNGNPILLPINDVLPQDEWHHVMTVAEVVTPIDPIFGSMELTYKVFIDGVQQGGTIGPNDVLSATCCILGQSPNDETGIGWQEFGNPPDEMVHFHGQLAMTRLSYGVLYDPDEMVNFSLFQPTTPENNGDYNFNGRVDAADYVAWRKTLGQGVTNGTGADGSGDGTVGPEDYAYWRARFGNVVAVGLTFGSAGSVPEPSALLLCFAGFLIATASHRTRFELVTRQA